jgi:hypothetical protein
VTLTHEVDGHSDSGEPVAEALGLRVEAFSHPLGDRLSDLRYDAPEDLDETTAQFIATVGLGDDLAFAPFAPALRGAIYLSGAFGDAAWGTNRRFLPGLPVRIPFAKSLTEFRLATGFAHVPVPAIGVRFAAPMARLSSDAGLAGYSVGGDYDRPIPRRIVEQAGVPRELFGQRKLASSPVVLNQPDLFVPAMRQIAALRYAEESVVDQRSGGPAPR